MNRRQFNRSIVCAGAAAFAPFHTVSAQSSKLKVGVLLPKSGLQGLIGQSCQKGADLAPAVIRDLLGIDIELMNADTETNVDTARIRAERLIQEGAHCLVGAFDSGAAASIAQVAEQRSVPFIINIAAAPRYRTGLQIRVSQFSSGLRIGDKRPNPRSRSLPGYRRGAAHCGVHARQRHLRTSECKSHHLNSPAAQFAV